MTKTRRYSVLRRVLLAYIVASATWGILVGARIQRELVAAERSAAQAELASRMEAISARLTPLLQPIANEGGDPTTVLDHRLRAFVTGEASTDLGLRALDVQATSDRGYRATLGDMSRADHVLSREYWITGAPQGPADYLIKVGVDDRTMPRADGRGLSMAALWFGLGASWLIAGLLYRQIGARLREVNRIVDAILLGTPGSELQVMSGDDEFGVLGRKVAVAMQIVEGVSTDVPAANQPTQRIYAVEDERTERSAAA